MAASLVVRDAAQEPDPAHAGHADVEDDQVRFALAQLHERFLAAARPVGLESLVVQKVNQRLQQVFVVIHDKDVLLRSALLVSVHTHAPLRAAIGRGSRRYVPFTSAPAGSVSSALGSAASTVSRPNKVS